MAIQNAEVTRYCNEAVRPLAERFRALKVDVDAALAEWYATISPACPIDGGTVEDGREAEGVSRLTGNDVALLIAQLAAFQTQLNGGGVANVIGKPCVRFLVTQG